MGNLFTPSGKNKAGTIPLPTITTNPDNTKVTFKVLDYLKKVNGNKPPSPASVNKEPNNFGTTNNSKGAFFDVGAYYDSIGKQESNNNYSALGQMITKGRHKGTQAWGKYQFMPKTLADLGINVTKDEFLKNHKLQEQAMRQLTQSNAKILGITDFAKLNQRQFKALSMAHYSGVGKAKKWLQSGISSEFTRVQDTTRDAHPSIVNYADSTLNIAQNNQGIYKPSELNKAQHIFNKLVSTSKGE
jgi:hypothetical protein